ncbi:MAG: hypothetical protein Q8K65_03145 [Alphaproteobacteria bacterium]|nr:hypothetical protein [Alphaproteobacteria bacterium]
MNWFTGNKKDEKPAPREREAESWNDGLSTALPAKAQFFDSMRTDAYQNLNLVENHIEFWAALRVDPAEDKWRVMHYMIFSLDREDGKFVAEVHVKDSNGKPKDVTFAEAVSHLARTDYVASNLNDRAAEEVDAKYPADKYPEIKAHYHDLEHYKGVANIEGIAFNEHNEPYRRVEGKIFADATFQRSEVVKSILAVDGARDVPQVKAKIEGGILSDIFTSHADKGASLDQLLNIGKVLIAMDQFAVQVGAAYLAAQVAAGKDDGFERIEGLKPAEKKKILEQARAALPSMSEETAAKKALRDIIPEMNEQLSQAEALGVHVEPFQKFAAEMELYFNLVHASKNRSRLMQDVMSPSNADGNTITDIVRSVDQAQKKFFDLGGSQEQMDKLKAWVVSPSKDQIPGWVPGFLTRYYTSRGKIMEKVQQRRAGATQVKVLPAEVKPPIADEHNEGALRSQQAAKPKAAPGQNP